jgi:hypothetical protein
MNKIFRVVIVSQGGGILQDRRVIARSEKAALLAVVKSIPEDDKAWQAPGWRDVQVYESRDAFILAG